MKQYNRVMLGRGSIYADECKEGGFIGTNFLRIMICLAICQMDGKLLIKSIYLYIYKKIRKNKKLLPVFPVDFSGLCVVGLEIGDIVLTPNGKENIILPKL